MIDRRSSRTDRSSWPSGVRPTPQRDPELAGQDLPRDDVGVVLEEGEDHDVALLQVGATPRLDGQVQALGGVLDEDAARFRRRVDEALDLQPSRFEGLGGVGGELVRAAVGRGVGGLVEPLHRVEHRARLLARRRGIQVDDPPPVDLPIEDREVLADPFDVEVGHDDLQAS